MIATGEVAAASTWSRRAVVFAAGSPEAWIPVLRSLREAVAGIQIVVGGTSEATLASLADHADELVGIRSGCELLEREAARGGAHLLVVVAPSMFPSDAFDKALRTADSDLRCSSVSFLSNAADYASFPPVESIGDEAAMLDPQETTDRLRGANDGLELVAIPFPVGPVVVLTAQGLSLVRPFPQHGHHVARALADFGARARARGLLDVLDPTTYVAQPLPAGGVEDRAATFGASDQAWLEENHPGLGAAARRHAEPHSALGEAMDVARAVVHGLRVIIDGTCLGPQEMGTQVALLEQVEALAARDEVAYLGVVLAGPVPGYAVGTLSSEKVDARQADLDTLEGFPDVDIFYRSFQVTPGVDPVRWRAKCRRIVTAIQDLIAFEIPGYQDHPTAWLDYRATMRHACSVVDGVVTISTHTRDTVVLERLGVDASRLFVVPDGIGHVTGAEDVVQPRVLLERGFAGESFLLVLGTNYSHKNRDLGIATLRELRRRGFDLSLVLAGASVPSGSSTAAEDALRSPADQVFVLPDISSAERNWLFRHASLVLYPTGAEGFGFVPHEAAAFGTPTVMVPIPALAERMPSLPVSPRDWSIESLADACTAILEDPALGVAQIKAINDAEPNFNWERSAELLVDVFRSLLSRPAVASL